MVNPDLFHYLEDGLRENLPVTQRSLPIRLRVVTLTPPRSPAQVVGMLPGGVSVGED